MALDAEDLWRRGRRRRMVTRTAGPVVALVLAVAATLLVLPGHAHHAGPATQISVVPGPVTPVESCTSPATEDPTTGVRGLQMVDADRGWAVSDQGILATVDGGTHWGLQLTAPDFDLRALDFVDATHGWAIGTSGVLATTDGGRHWSALPLRCPSISSLHFSDETHGWAVRDTAPTSLISTTDGGRTWVPQTAPAPPQSVCFSTSTEGLLGADGAIYRSLDGGRSWTESLKAQDFEDQALVQCTGRGYGWAELTSTNGYAGTVPHDVVHFDGSTWTDQHRVGSYPGPLSALSGSAAVWFGNRPQGPDATTTSTALQGGERSVEGLTDVIAASFLTKDLGWVAGLQAPYDGRASSVRILRTQDGGRTWRVQYESALTSAGPGCGDVHRPSGGFPAAELADVQMITADEGWAVGASQILVTSDAGHHWDVQLQRSGMDLISVDFVDAHSGWAAGPGLLLHTVDGGAHWVELPQPCAPIRQVHFTSPTVGYAVADLVEDRVSYDEVTTPPTGRLLRSTDGGVSWQPVLTPGPVSSACFTSASDGWLGQADGSIWRSTDGGSSWTDSLPLATERFGATVACADGGAAWATVRTGGLAGGEGPHAAFHSTGGSWTPIYATTPQGAPPVTATPAPGAYAGPISPIDAETSVFVDTCPSCESARSLVAVVGPSGFTSHPTTGEQWVTGVSFTSPTSGVVVGRGGSQARIQWTADGGRTWTVGYAEPAERPAP